MKKVLAVILAITLAFSMVLVFTACGGKKDATTTAAEKTTEAETVAEATTAAENAPKAGETLQFSTMSVKIPDGWAAKDFEEGKKVELHTKEGSFEYVGITLHKVYDGNHAKEWAKNIDENYGGNNEIDEIEIGGKTFYRVKADPEQNVCFADIDDENYIEVAVMFMPWDSGKPALSNISFS
ncbi:MAG: hypothetical protein IJI67_06350 [Clostridia bacterium]|nr:hypothetical protein [Clostridia bacterium]